MNILSSGCLKQIFSQEKFANQIVIQIIDIKKIFIKENESYQLIISDGKYWSNLALLTCDLNEIVQSEIIKKNVIIDLHKFDLFAVKSEEDGELLILLIKQLNIRENQAEIILGNPKQLILDKVELFQNEKSKSSLKSNTMTALNDDSNKVFKLINDLEPESSNWILKARVSEKYPLKSWANKTGSGNILNFELIDQTGLIRAVAFKDLADKYNDFIQQNEIYQISNGVIRFNKTLYVDASIKNEILITSDTILENITKNEETFPVKTYKLSSLREIKNKEKNEIVDVAAICWHVGELESVSIASLNKSLIKRDIVLIDDTDSVTLTVWNETAENFNYKSQSVLLIHNGRINEFNNLKYITTSNNSIIRMNPEIENNDFLKSISMVSIFFLVSQLFFFEYSTLCIFKKSKFNFGRY